MQLIHGGRERMVYTLDQECKWLKYSRVLPVDSSKVQNHHHLIHPFDVQIHFVLKEKIKITSVSIIQSPSQINQIHHNRSN